MKGAAWEVSGYASSAAFVGVVRRLIRAVAGSTACLQSGARRKKGILRKHSRTLQ
jgi:hypothetical protein